MGAVVSAITDAVSDVVDTVGDALDDVGDFVVNEIVEPVGKAVDSTVKSIADDPIGAAAKLAAVATGQFELLPLISAADTLAHGGSLEQAALNAGVAYVAGQVGGEFADYTDSGLAGGAGAGATAAAIKGKDIVQGGLTGGINYGINSGVNEAFSGGCGDCGDCGSDVSEKTCGSDTADEILQAQQESCAPQGCASTQDQGGLPTVISKADAGVQNCGPDECGPDVCGPDCEQCAIQDQAIGQPEACNIECEARCCDTGCCEADCCDTGCCEEGSGFRNPFKIKVKPSKAPKVRGAKTPKVKIAGGKPSRLPGTSMLGALPGMGGGVCIGDACGSGCGAIPWLNTKAEMLRNQVKLDRNGNVVPVSEKANQAEDIYAKMESDLAKEFQDRFGGVPQVNINALGGLGGSFAEKSGYASGGCVTSCYCLNQSPKYMPRFIQCGPDTLTTTGPLKRQPVGQKQLKQLAQQISTHGNMGGLAKGGLPEKYRQAAPKGHDPEFVTGITGYYACGGGTGQSDDIKAMLHDGDYVMDADVVAALGDGSSKAGMNVLDGFLKQVPHSAKNSGQPVPARIADGEYVFPEGFVTALGGGDNKAGAKILDGLREKLRAHKRSAPTSKIPPKAKSPLDYIKAKG